MLKHSLAPLFGLTVLTLAACSGGSDTGTGSDTAEGSVVEPTMADTQDELILQARTMFEPLPLTPPAVPGVATTPALVDLGKALFFDPRLSATHSISCAACHNPGLGGADGSPTSAGFHGTRGPRNSPTVFNAGYNFTQFWDGRAKDLVEQAGGPIVNPVEMAASETQVVEELQSLPGYAKLFQGAFPGDKTPINFKNVTVAIAAYEATLITPNAPFDRFLRGDASALDAQAKDGLRLFMDKGCTACHTGVNLGGTMYQKFGVVADPEPKYRPADDKGRGGVTGDANEDYFFKVPSLRDITLTAPYFHTGSEPDLKKAVQVMAETQLGQTLTPKETDQITAFLGSLTGDQPQITIPILPANGSASPDPQE